MNRMTLLMLLLAAAPLTLAQSAALPKPPAKAGQCVACHGGDGQSRLPANPILRCQHEAYLISALNAYRSGARRHPVMQSIANTLQPKDIKTLAAWYANQPGCKK
jgi:cytochrome c553